MVDWISLVTCTFNLCISTAVAECLECDVNAVCVNTEDSYTCACKEGYDGDGNTCRSTKGKCRTCT